MSCSSKSLRLLGLSASLSVWGNAGVPFTLDHLGSLLDPVVFREWPIADQIMPDRGVPRGVIAKERNGNHSIGARTRHFLAKM